MNRKHLGPLVFALVIAAIFSQSFFYSVKEWEQVIITQFGQPQGDPIKTAGLHSKLPWQNANFLPMQILRWDGNPREIVTKDKKYIFIDTTARWRIIDPLKFFLSARNEESAHARLDGIIDSAVRNNITEHPLLEVVRTSKEALSFIQDEDNEEFGHQEAVEVKFGRDDIMNQVLAEVKKQTLEVFGIEILDVKIKSLNYIEEVRKKVYERMISERLRIAEKYRSEGMGEKEKIMGTMEKEMKRISSEAYRKAKEIEGAADAEAIKIYAEAFNKDPGFFTFYRTLKAYEEMTPKDLSLVISSDKDFFKYIQGIE